MKPVHGKAMLLELALVFWLLFPSSFPLLSFFALSQALYVLRVCMNMHVLMCMDDWAVSSG